ncbi:hypothetical protein [Pseudarthrobacter albicanus]|uniref:hypothetical protein n=1 Tax=Pseudarthrobacter albicanus TaxID=2823873 RepID=UPI001BAC4352|nr:hypothetical protein [Pseudarthrobacter albicanus]
MDQATIVGYALGYIVTISVIFLMFLPSLITFVLLLLSAGAVQLVILLLKAVTLVAVRTLARLPRRRAGDELAPH